MKDTGVRQRGFSLIEVIIVLTAAALIGAFITSFFGKSYFESMKAGSTLTKAQGLQKVMENIFSDFKNKSTSDWPHLRTKIGTENSDMDNAYGKYRVIENRFIKFIDAGGGNLSEAVGVATDNLLKVTIKNELGETLTIVFSPQ